MRSLQSALSSSIHHGRLPVPVALAARRAVGGGAYDRVHADAHPLGMLFLGCKHSVGTGLIQVSWLLLEQAPRKPSRAHLRMVLVSRRVRRRSNQWAFRYPAADVSSGAAQRLMHSLHSRGIGPR